MTHGLVVRIDLPIVEIFLDFESALRAILNGVPRRDENIIQVAVFKRAACEVRGKYMRVRSFLRKAGTLDCQAIHVSAA